MENLQASYNKDANKLWTTQEWHAKENNFLIDLVNIAMVVEDTKFTEDEP